MIFLDHVTDGLYTNLKSDKLRLQEHALNCKYQVCSIMTTTLCQGSGFRTLGHGGF